MYLITYHTIAAMPVKYTLKDKGKVDRYQKTAKRKLYTQNLGCAVVIDLQEQV